MDAMLLLVLNAYLQLIKSDFHLARGRFAVLYNKIRERAVRNGVRHPHSIEEICQAVDVASIWYRKRVHCLQRSAATTCVLKSYGYRAEMVIGAQQMPFRAHAWVEIEGRVVNDRPYTPEIYAVLDRC
jgi:hypothetical protein